MKGGESAAICVQPKYCPGAITSAIRGPVKCIAIQLQSLVNGRAIVPSEVFEDLIIAPVRIYSVDRAVEICSTPLRGPIQRVPVKDQRVRIKPVV